MGRPLGRVPNSRFLATSYSSCGAGVGTTPTIYRDHTMGHDICGDRLCDGYPLGALSNDGDVQRKAPIQLSVAPLALRSFTLLALRVVPRDVPKPPYSHSRQLRHLNERSWHFLGLHFPGLNLNDLLNLVLGSCLLGC